MTTVFNKFEPGDEDWKMLHSIFSGKFLEGECYAFATALHQGLGWPIVGLMKEDVIWHAGVRSPEGVLRDVRGDLSEREFGSYFLTPPFVLRDVLVADLYATRPIDGQFIKRARQMAEVLWPDLPWLDSAASRAIAFADELEVLSRKHGLWICGSVPADPPCLFQACGDEGGYQVRPMVGGFSHTIYRYLV